jgi:hypothetical protein
VGIRLFVEVLASMFGRAHHAKHLGPPVRGKSQTRIAASTRNTAFSPNLQRTHNAPRI